MQSQERKEKIVTDPVLLFQEFFRQMQGRAMEEDERRMMEEVFQAVKEERE